METKMKTLARSAAVLCLVLAAGAAPLLAQAPNEAPPKPMATAAPKDAILCLAVDDSVALRRALRESAAGRTVGESALLKSGLAFLQAARDFALQYLGEVSGDRLQELLPSEWALLVFDLPPDAGELQQPGVVCVGRLPAGKGDELEKLWTERLFPRVQALIKDAKIERGVYRDVPVYRFQKPEESPLAAAFVHGMLAFGSPPGVHRFVDEPPASGKSLTTDPDYQAAAERFFPEALATAFLGLGAPIRRHVSELAEGSKARKDAHLLGLEFIRSLSGSVKPADGRFHEAVFLDMGDNAEEGLIGLLHSRRPISPRSAALVPDHYAVHLALSITSGAELFEVFCELVIRGEGEEARKNFDELREFTKAQWRIDLDQDLVGQVGAEAFAALAPPQDADWTGAKAKPRLQDCQFLIGLQVKDATVLRESLRRALDSSVFGDQGITLTVESHENVDFHIVRGPKLPAEGRAYAFFASFLILGRDTESLKQVLVALTERRSLARNPRCKAARAPFSNPAIATLYVNASPVLKQLIPALLEKEQPALQPFVPVLTELAAQAGEGRLVLRPCERGLLVDGDFALPLLTPLVGLAGAGHFGKPLAGRRAERAKDQMKEVGKALRKYYRKNQAPPDTLMQLEPTYIEELPTDPFRQGGHFGYGVSDGGAGWILTSVGPDGKADIDVDDYNEQQWRELRKTRDPVTIEKAKRLIYRFRPDKLRDEKPYDDEGDIFFTGNW